MADLSIFKLDSQTITIKDTTAREAADSAKTLATTASGNATTALNQINELESEISALKSDLANRLEFVGLINNKYSNLSELYNAGRNNTLKIGLYQWNANLRPNDANGIVFIGNWDVYAIQSDFKKKFHLNSNLTWTEIT